MNGAASLELLEVGNLLVITPIVMTVNPTRPCCCSIASGAYIALPAKINRCCGGGIPAFFSTSCFALTICGMDSEMSMRFPRLS